MGTAKLPADPRIAALVEELQAWPGPRIASHKSASQYFHKLAFLADAGLRHDDPGMESVVEKILESADENGIPCLSMEISVAHGGVGGAIKAWALCDAPITLYSLKRMGVRDERLDRAAAKLAGLCRGNGFGCAVSASLGAWRGPGKKSDPCPYATLVMLKLLLLYGDLYEEEIKTSSECLLNLWRNSRSEHPYIFYMGTDFRKLKLPTVWYDILHVADVLSRVKSCVRDPRLAEMIACIREKETPEGFIPESVYLPWKDWDFGQKKLASASMTRTIREIERRLSSPAEIASER